ncbi:hypothetical protein KY332_04785 [Candidatus Woesearchaeota archaeon]|nr:hypothetical protein [Candidatus Woesearchaeota archaeon]
MKAKTKKAISRGKKAANKAIKKGKKAAKKAVRTGKKAASKAMKSPAAKEIVKREKLLAAELLMKAARKLQREAEKK